MARKSAKDLMVGEMCIIDECDHFFHTYWKVIGHQHDEGVVLFESTHTGRKRKCDYDLEVMTRPMAYQAINDDLRSRWECYKKWPYDEKGHFCDPPRDYSNWKKPEKEFV